MCHAARFRLLLGLLLLSAGSTALARYLPARADNPRPAQGALRRGLLPDDVIKILGPPPRTSRQIFSHHTLEQWHYGPPHQVRIVFDCPRGQKPTLLHWRKAAQAGP
jgi:hypothetical protein